MPLFELSRDFTIEGIGAASGIVIVGDKLFLVSDAANRLFEYDLKRRALTTTDLASGPHSGHIPKKLKPDFEALAFYENRLLLFGSGSTQNRNTLAVVDPDSGAVAKHDLTALYRQMKSFATIGDDDFNIEGAVFRDNWFFFQRGNGPAAQNGIFVVDGDIFGNDFAIRFKSLHLPPCNGIATTFTDAVIAANKIWFLATAEDSRSVYDDGEILGTIVGTIDIATLEVTMTEKISDTNKFEGIAFLSETDNEIAFFLCEDNDTEALESSVYRLAIHK